MPRGGRKATDLADWCVLRAPFSPGWVPGAVDREGGGSERGCAEGLQA